jgi:hypothetical protein
MESLDLGSYRLCLPMPWRFKYGEIATHLHVKQPVFTFGANDLILFFLLLAFSCHTIAVVDVEADMEEAMEWGVVDCPTREEV